MFIRVKYHNVKKFVRLDAMSDSTEEFILRVRNRFMAEVGDEEIKFQDSDETEIGTEDLIEYILEKQSDSFILNICKETSAAARSSSVAYSTAAIDSLFASTSSACNDINICISPVKQYLKTAKEDVFLLSQDPKKVVNKALNKTAAGRNLIQEYEESDTLKPESRRALVRLIVRHIQEQHGKIPDENVKILYAKGILQNFPILQTAKSYELVDNPNDRSDYLSWRLRTVDRVSDSDNVPKKANIQANIQAETAFLANSSPENPRVPDIQVNEDQQKEIVEWLKNASPTTQLVDIEVKMRQSLKYRRTIILDPKLSKSIFIEFPRFLDTPGLIQKDFEALMPEYSSKFNENWQKFETRIVKVSETIKKKSTDIALWDRTIQTLFLLVHLLSPTAKGKKRPNHVTIDVAISRLISFHQIALPLPSKQELIKISLQPFLLAVGSNQQAISNFYVVFNGKFLPCPAHTSSISAFDTLFKAHYVFGCKYEESLEVFWKFVQMIFYGIDVDYVSFTPKMREVRARLFNVIIE